MELKYKEFFKAVSSGKIENVKLLLEGIDINYKNSLALIISIDRYNYDMFTFLLKNGCKVTDYAKHLAYKTENESFVSEVEEELK